MGLLSIASNVLQLLPIQLKSLEALADVIFWWNNFDGKIVLTSKKDSIHNTPGVAFQEIISESVSRGVETSIPKSRRHFLPNGVIRISVMLKKLFS